MHIQSKYSPYLYYFQFIGSIIALLLGFIIIYFVIIRPFNFVGLLLSLLMLGGGLYGLISWGNSEFKKIRIEGNDIFIGRVFNSNLLLFKSDITHFVEKEVVNDNSRFMQLKVFFKNAFVLEMDSNNLQNYKEIRSILVNGKIRKND